MFQLLESIRLENGLIINQEFHQRRIDNSSKELNQQCFDLNEIIIPDIYKIGLFKLRIVYSDFIEKIEFKKYQIRFIKSLKIIEDNTISYYHKFLNRREIENLFSSRGNCDDILIIKNDEITDTSYSNVVFFKNGEYFTPVNPLLKGTKRAYLIEQKIINPIRIYKKDIDKFEYCKIINAMINIDESPTILNIKF